MDELFKKNNNELITRIVNHFGTFGSLHLKSRVSLSGLQAGSHGDRTTATASTVFDLGRGALGMRKHVS